MDQFPIILIPSAIAQAKPSAAPQQNLPNPERPVRPQRPRPPDPEPQPIDKGTVAAWALLCFIFSFVCGIFSAAIFSSQIGLAIGGLVFLLSAGRLTHSTRQKLKSFPGRKKTHEQEQRYYLNQQQLYRKALKDFATKEKQYEADLKAYNEEYYRCSKLADAERERFRQVLSQTAPPDGEGSGAKRGYSEKKFESYLHQYFPGKICTGLTMQNPSYDRRYPYTADFAYIEPAMNLHIDIEVDEPYDYTSRQPRHYVGLETEKKRNRFFTDRLWIVIRFSEEQVVRWPDSCCKTVAEVIADVMGDKPLPPQFTGIPSLKQMPRWTEQEARLLAADSYRQTYLRGDRN